MNLWEKTKRIVFNPYLKIIALIVVFILSLYLQLDINRNNKLFGTTCVSNIDACRDNKHVYSTFLENGVFPVCFHEDLQLKCIARNSTDLACMTKITDFSRYYGTESSEYQFQIPYGFEIVIISGLSAVLSLVFSRRHKFLRKYRFVATCFDLCRMVSFWSPVSIVVIFLLILSAFNYNTMERISCNVKSPTDICKQLSICNIEFRSIWISNNIILNNYFIISIILAVFLGFSLLLSGIYYLSNEEEEDYSSQSVRYTPQQLAKMMSNWKSKVDLTEEMCECSICLRHMLVQLKNDNTNKSMRSTTEMSRRIIKTGSKLSLVRSFRNSGFSGNVIDTEEQIPQPQQQQPQPGPRRRPSNVVQMVRVPSLKKMAVTDTMQAPRDLNFQYALPMNSSPYPMSPPKQSTHGPVEQEQELHSDKPFAKSSKHGEKIPSLSSTTEPKMSVRRVSRNFELKPSPLSLKGGIHNHPMDFGSISRPGSQRALLSPASSELHNPTPLYTEITVDTSHTVAAEKQLLRSRTTSDDNSDVKGSPKRVDKASPKAYQLPLPSDRHKISAEETHLSAITNAAISEKASKRFPISAATNSFRRNPTTSPAKSRAVSIYPGDYLLAQVPCGHIFHKACIEEWAEKHHQCPMCRADLATGKQEEKKVELREDDESRGSWAMSNMTDEEGEEDDS